MQMFSFGLLIFSFLKKNSSGFTDFAVRRIKHAQYGRREIEIAEQGLFISRNDHRQSSVRIDFINLCVCMSVDQFLFIVDEIPVDHYPRRRRKRKRKFFHRDQTKRNTLFVFSRSMLYNFFR